MGSPTFKSVNDLGGLVVCLTWRCEVFNQIQHIVGADEQVGRRRVACCSHDDLVDFFGRLLPKRSVISDNVLRLRARKDVVLAVKASGGTAGGIRRNCSFASRATATTGIFRLPDTSGRYG